MPGAPDPIDVSVIIPAFDAAGTIERAVRSAGSQVGVEFEIIVVDDGSSDDTAAIVRALCDELPLRVIEHPANRGGSAARNTGADVARGRWLAFLDADDEWLPSRLRHTLQQAEATAADFALGSFHWGHEPDVVVTPSLPPRSRRSELLAAPPLGAGSSLVVLRSMFRRVLGFDTELPRHQDWDLVLRLAEAGRGVVVTDDLIRLHRTGRPTYGSVVLAKRGFLAKHEPSIASLDDGERRRVRALHQIDLARYARYERRAARMLAHLAAAMRVSPGTTVTSLMATFRRRRRHAGPRQPHVRSSSSVPRVLIVAPGRPAEGGMAAVAGRLVGALDGVDVQLVRSRGGGSWFGDALGYVMALFRVLRCSLGRQPTVLHLNLAPRGSALRKVGFATIARLTRRPYVVHIHSGRFGAWLRATSPLVRRGIRTMFLRSAGVWVLAETFRAELMDTLQLPASLFVIVPNGVAAPPAKLRVDAARGELLFIGRFEHIKGLDTLFAALAHPSLRDRDWRCTLIGTGSWPVAEELSNHPMRARIRVLGWTEQEGVWRALERANAVVLPSRTEGMPLVVLEAFAARRPVVASAVGAVPELLDGGALGLLVPPDAPDQLAGSIRAVLDDQDAAQRRASLAYRAWQQRWSIEVFESRVNEIYRTLISDRWPGRA